MLDLGDVVVRKQALFPSQSTGPPSRCIFFDDVDDVVGVEAELVCVLGVVGVQRLTLRNLRLGLRLGLGGRFGPTRTWRRSVGGRSVCISSI